MFITPKFPFVFYCFGGGGKFYEKFSNNKKYCEPYKALKELQFIKKINYPFK